MEAIESGNSFSTTPHVGGGWVRFGTSGGPGNNFGPGYEYNELHGGAGGGGFKPPVKQKETKPNKVEIDSLSNEIDIKTNLISALKESRDYLNKTIEGLEREYFELVEKLIKEV